MDLSSALLVKDNHIAALGGVKAAVEAVRYQVAGRRGLTLEVEVDDLDELDQALDAGAKLVLVDNMSLADTAEAVRRAIDRGAEVEASGRLNLANVKAVARTGVHYVAIGSLTHSSPALDIGLDWAISSRCPRYPPVPPPRSRPQCQPMLRDGADFEDLARDLGDDAVLHLHGLEDPDRLPGFDEVTRLDEDAHDRPLHRHGHMAARRIPTTLPAVALAPLLAFFLVPGL